MCSYMQSELKIGSFDHDKHVENKYMYIVMFTIKKVLWFKYIYVK